MIKNPLDTIEREEAGAWEKGTGFKTEPSEHPREELDALHAKIDALTDTVGRIDRRREELEELLEDLMPAVNGVVVLLRDRMNVLDRSGAWANGQASLQAAETALAALDPTDLQALAEATPDLLRTLRVVTAPEVTRLADRFVESLDDAKHGPAPSLWKMGRSARSPRVRRGMGVALSLLESLGEGTRGIAASRPTPRLRASSSAAAPRSAPPACQLPGPAGPTPVEGQLAGKWGLDGDGFLADSNDWTREVAEAFATEEGITLGDAQWTVLDFVREDGAASGAAPGVRRIVAETGVPQKELYRLFPGGPARVAARLAGLKKPKSCV